MAEKVKDAPEKAPEDAKTPDVEKAPDVAPVEPTPHAAERVETYLVRVHMVRVASGEYVTGDVISADKMTLDEVKFLLDASAVDHIPHAE